jgi:uncharacterized membrane protein YraQ (UPF0718 family)
VINGALLVFVAVVIGLVAIAWLRGGTPLVREGLAGGTNMLLGSGLLVALSFLAAGLAEVLIPRDLMPRAFGVESGLRGILIAAGAGVLTPSGPFVAIPIAAAMGRSGAATGPLVAYVSGWGLLAVHRLVAWEIPILGARLALTRWGVCLVLPVIAGLLARLVAGARG